MFVAQKSTLLRVDYLDGDLFRVSAVGNSKCYMYALLKMEYWERITEKKITPEHLIEFAIRFLCEKNTDNKPLPENIDLQKFCHVFPDWRSELALHLSEKNKLFISRKFQFDSIKFMKMCLLCMIWPFYLMKIYVRFAQGKATLEEVLVYPFMIFAGIWITMYALKGFFWVFGIS